MEPRCVSFLGRQFPDKKDAENKEFAKEGGRRWSAASFAALPPRRIRVMAASRVPLLAALAAALSCLLLLPSHQRTAILDSCTAWQSIGCLSVLEPARENVKGGGHRPKSFDDPLCLNASAGVGGAEGAGAEGAADGGEVDEGGIEDDEDDTQEHEEPVQGGRTPGAWDWCVSGLPQDERVIIIPAWRGKPVDGVSGKPEGLEAHDPRRRARLASVRHPRRCLSYAPSHSQQEHLGEGRAVQP